MSASHAILIVADDADQRLLFEIVLKKAGYDVVAVEDAETALARLETEDFDLVLTDYMLPGMFGDALIGIIRERRLPVKMVLMSNHLDVRYLAEACAADGFFRKEDIKELVALLGHLLAPKAPTEA